MASSVYIHIPFCKQKCKYCSFISFAKIEKQFEYIDSLIKEIDFYYKKEDIKTLYFGGGTPSLLDIGLLKKVFNKFKLNPNYEATIEINPDDANEEYFKKLKNIGFNRISIGAQTFDNNILKIIGRRHNSEQTIQAIKSAQKARFNNISVDLIYGLPEQTIETLKKDLETVKNLNIQHISTYGLKIEEESAWGKFVPKNIPDDDMQADMYLIINNFLKQNEYFRYEISNFAKENQESKHNLNYWNNQEYYGFGIAAHGYINGIRYSNPQTLEVYLKNPVSNRNEHSLSLKEQLEEEIFLGFRKIEGLNIININKKYQIDFNNKYKKQIQKYAPKYIEPTSTGYKLTLEGTLLSNIILADFI